MSPESTMTVVRRIVILLFTTAVMTNAVGCQLGPRAVETTHGRYGEAVLRVDEEQLLRNIVRLRYTESPRNIDVASIAAQYEASSGAGIGSSFSTEVVSGNLQTATAFLPNFSLNASNRPTVTYRPDDDGEATRRLLTPISSETLVFLIESGWPVSTVLRLWVDQINGIPNGYRVSGPPNDKPVDVSRFNKCVELLQSATDQQLLTVKLQDRFKEIGGAIPKDSITATANVEAVKAGLEYAPRADSKEWGLVKREHRLVLEVVPGTENEPILKELWSQLNLKQGQNRYEIVAVTGGTVDPAVRPTDPSSVLRLNPRSPIQVFFFLANSVEVPCEHSVAPIAPGASEVTTGLMRVYSCPGRRRPANAYVAIPYRDHWYYIADDDAASKSTLLLILQMNRLDLKRDLPNGSSPALTLQVGR
jgi:hypothetical protein